MRTRIQGKFLSGSICCFAAAAFMHRDAVKSVSIGKDAYLAEQAQYFDKTLAWSARSPLVSIVGALFVLGFMFVVYELLAFCIARFLQPTVPAAEDQQLGQGF